MEKPDPQLKQKQKFLFLLTGICLAGVILLSIFLFLNRTKIGYVNTGPLIEGYVGMKEARNNYQSQSQIWQANIDTLQLDFQRAVNKYNIQLPELYQQEKATQQASLKQMQDNIIQYTNAIKEKAQKEDERITKGVLNQINSYIGEYGEKHGFDIILGTTASGSLLYAKDKIDITEDILKGLNESYNPSLLKEFTEEKKDEKSK